MYRFPKFLHISPPDMCPNNSEVRNVDMTDSISTDFYQLKWKIVYFRAILCMNKAAQLAIDRQWWRRFIASGVFTIELIGRCPSPLKIYVSFFAILRSHSLYIFELIDILNWQRESGHNRLTRLLIYNLVLEVWRRQSRDVGYTWE